MAKSSHTSCSRPPRPNNHVPRLPATSRPLCRARSRTRAFRLRGCQVDAHPDYEVPKGCSMRARRRIFLFSVEESLGRLLQAGASRAAAAGRDAARQVAHAPPLGSCMSSSARDGPTVTDCAPSELIVRSSRLIRTSSRTRIRI